jgi:bacterioferritin-associated ferredoxin
VMLGATTLNELREGLGVAGNCGKCDGCARDVLREALSGGQCHAHAQAA